MSAHTAGAWPVRRAPDVGGAVRAALAEIEQLRILSRRITAALVTVAVVAMTFTAVSVTLFAIDHGVSVWIAWMLDPMVAAALLTVLLVDARLVELGTGPSGWATALRWFAGLGTWVMNVWSSVWPDGSFGVPTEVDAAGVVLHSIPPVLLIVLAEAATGYRRVIADRIRHLEGVAARVAVAAPTGAPMGPAVATDPHGDHRGDRVPYRPGDRPHDRTPVAVPVAPVVVEPVVSGAVGDRADDHVHDRHGDRPPVALPVAPVVAATVTAPAGAPAPDNHRADQAHGRTDDRAPADEAAFPAAAGRPVMSADEEVRAARRMHRAAVKANGRPVTVDALRFELGLSRRRAVEVRRLVVELNGVARR